MRGRLLLLLVLLSCAYSSLTYGGTTGAIAGAVKDAAGAPLPGVSVEASSASLQGTRRTVTGAYGEFRLSAIPPGLYHVRAAVTGFRATVAVVRVGVDATATANLTVRMSAKEDVSVTAEIPFLDSTSTTSIASYTSRILSHLPCDRGYAWVVAATPGVGLDRAVNQMRSVALAIAGATSAENGWAIDGVNAANVSRGIQGKELASEFVDEVEVKTGGYQAEYGRALGGVINVVTKSGGNQFKGEAFFYYDSSSLQARAVAVSDDAARMRIATYERRDYGAALGGYVVRDRLWFFAGYDRIELPARIGRIESTDEVSSSDRFPLNARTNLYSGKLTWNLGGGTTAVASLAADPGTTEGAGAADPRLGHGSFVPPEITNPDPSTWRSSHVVGGTDLSLRVTRPFGPRTLVSLQGARHEDRFELQAPDEVRTEDWTCDGGSPGNPCNPPDTPRVATGGYGFIFGPVNRGRSRRSQYRADWDFTRGSHDFKAGGDFQDATTESISSFTGGQVVGIYNEQGRTYYLHRFFARGEEDLRPLPDSRQNSAVRDTGLYIQDSWRPASGWTVNAGLRWDDEAIRDGRGITRIRTNRWQPRLGVAWDPAASGRTRIYASAGRFAWGLPTDLSARVWGFTPNAFTWNFDPLSTTQDPTVPGHRTSFVPGGGFDERIDPNLQGIYQDEYAVGVERLLDPSLSVGLRATYRRLGNTIEDRCDLDPDSPGASDNTCGIANPGSSGGIASGRGDLRGCNGLDGDAYQCDLPLPAMPPARRLYRGIELVARNAVGDRLWIQASYVYSSLRGNFDGAISQVSGQTDPGINADYDYAPFAHNAYGRLTLDRPHRLRFDGFYTLPGGASVGLQAFAASGAPMDKLGYFNFYYRANLHLVPRGSAGRLPTQWDANLTLSYPIVLGPATVTLRGYVFNLFNNQIPIWRNTAWSSGGAPDGYPASLFDPNQEQTNPEYGKVVARSEPRLFRAAIRVSF